MNSLGETLRSLYTHSKNPSPPYHPYDRIRTFTFAFYGVVLFEAVVLAVLVYVYPDNYLKHMWELFFSELGAPVTQFGTPNRLGSIIFSGNMIGGAVGCAAFIPIVKLYFPISTNGFYKKIRYFYYACIGMMAVGNIGIVIPYTVSWAAHVIGAFICMIGMWLGWTAFVLFNTVWLSFRKRIALIVTVDAIIWFVLIAEFSNINQELFQKPGQGLIFGLVILWPLLHLIKSRG